ncbi:LOW QUALITY PROTEIN: nicastrin [Lepeophtheirus salmonis]|uniref:LOW QUALITY PROTEIN: nicastrin n=1 Tax=Lepeophtheirus salmonis TaxID=72036 RepID=UPI003AF3F324
MMKKRLLSLFLCLLPLSIQAQRIKDQIYVPIKDTKFCFRRTNGSSQFGCSSSIGGNVGILSYLESKQDLDRILGPEGVELAPYIALLDPLLFNGQVLEAMESSGRFTGVLLLKENIENMDTPYSDDKECPNQDSSIYGSTCSKWNTGGQATLFKDWSFPIMLITEEESINYLKKCYLDHNDYNLKNRSWPYCAVEMRSHMYSALDTTTCIRRSNMINNLKPTTVCDPMGDFNLFYSLKSRNYSQKEESVIMITTRLDSVTLFDRAEISAVSPVTGIVTMLALASMISKSSLPHRIEGSNVIFAFMNGESFDYIGSSRMVYDMMNGNFPFHSDQSFSDHEEDVEKGSKQPPMDLGNIKFILELDQLASIKDKSKLFGHYYQPSESRVNKYMESLKAAAKGKIDFSKSSTLPPSSIMSFLKEKSDIPAILLSNYENEFVNPFYHSIYDDARVALNYKYKNSETQELVVRIAELTEMIMEFMYAEMTDTVKQDFKADRNLINELLHCYIDTANCSMFQASLSDHLLPAFLTEGPFPQYVGVRRSHIPHSRITYQLLGLLTGTQLSSDVVPSNCTQEEKGSNIYDYIFMRSLNPPNDRNFSSCVMDPNCGYCFKTTTFMTPAVSPAFIIENYDFKNSTYSAWAESLWKITSARIFLKDSPSLEITHFVIGVIIAVSSYILMWWLNRKATLLFSPVPSGNSSAIVTNDFSQAEAL